MKDEMTATTIAAQVHVDVDAMIPADVRIGVATFKAGSCRWRDLIALQHFLSQQPASEQSTCFVNCKWENDEPPRGIVFTAKDSSNGDSASQ